ncbi:MAG: HAD family hydrolase [Myxococcales bacterium]|nr:MAG: HAD family hydrolase [Myxococcales bacterium]
MSELRGVLLDIDGTLVDSNDAHALAWIESLEQFGHKASLEVVRDAIGMGGDRILPMLIKIEEDTPEGQAIAKARSQIFRSKYLPSLRAFAQTRELVERILGAGLKVGMATSAKAQEVDALLRIARVDDLLKVGADSSDIESSKPSPDVVQVALKKLGLAPHEAVLIGDTPYDVKAGKRAGVKVIALRCGGHPDEALEGADNIRDDVADLLRHIDQTVLGAAVG